MRRLLVLFLTFSSWNALGEGWDRDVLVGEWETYSYQYMRSYERLIINDDFSGCWSVFNDHEQYIESCFTPKDITFQDGYAVIDLGESAQFILSAWGNGGRLLGNMMLYKPSEKGRDLFNSKSVSYTKVGETNLFEFFNKA
jgi:hypothetical protein